jgi:hypothetical protein
MNILYKYQSETPFSIKDQIVVSKGNVIAFNGSEVFNMSTFSVFESDPLIEKQIIECCIPYNKEEEMSIVTHPSHYTQGSIECIDAMLSAYGKEAVMNFCQCNAFKYLWRFNHKNHIEDLNKAEWYIDKYIELHLK